MIQSFGLYSLFTCSILMIKKVYLISRHGHIGLSVRYV